MEQGRQIFDLIGPAERVRGRPVLKPEFTDEMGLRRALALLTETDILLLSNELSANYLSRLTAQAVLANEKVFPYILRQVSKGDFQDLATELREVTAFPSSSYGLTLARTAWRRSRAGVYLDRPNILTYHSGARPKAQDQIVQFQGFDIVANFVTVDLDVHRAPFRERIEQGVLDTYAETLLLSGADATIKAGEVIGTFPALKDDWLVVGSPQHLQQQDTQLSKDVRARIENELSAGYLVLLPRPESRATSIEQVGWWHVDRNTGEALRIGENGWRASTTEWIITNVTWLLSWGACHFTTALGRPVNLLLCTAGFDLGFVGGALMVTPYTTAAVLLLLAAEALFVTSAFLQ